MAEPDGAALTKMYELAATVVATDAKFRNVIMSGQATLMFYPARGQELIPAAVSVNLRPDDYVVTNYRGLHDQISKGVPLPALFAEYLGRVTGTCKGKGGPMHITHPASGLMVTTGVVGGGIPIANGLALASTLRGDGRVTVVFFGDGATNIGGFHEALNMAGLWKLPVVFCCQNNHYAEHTRFEAGTSVDSVSERAAAYKVPGVTVDGNNAVAMWSAAHDAIARARAGDGPTLIEAMTYRFDGHFFGDDTHYMPAEEMAAAVAADPVAALRSSLIAQGHATEDELSAAEARIASEVDAALAFAMGSPMAEPNEIYVDVYAEEVSR